MPVGGAAAGGPSQLVQIWVVQPMGNLGVSGRVEK